MSSTHSALRKRLAGKRQTNIRHIYSSLRSVLPLLPYPLRIIVVSVHARHVPRKALSRDLSLPPSPRTVASEKVPPLFLTRVGICMGLPVGHVDSIINTRGRWSLSPPSRRGRVGALNMNGKLPGGARYGGGGGGGRRLHTKCARSVKKNLSKCRHE